MARGTIWSQDEEMLLAEIVLRNIRQGYSISRAYDEAEKRIGRTRQAVAAYWNNNLAGAYYNALEIAQMQGRKAREERKVGSKVDTQHIEWIKKKYPEEDNDSIINRIEQAKAEGEAYTEADDVEDVIIEEVKTGRFVPIQEHRYRIDQHETLEISGFGDVVNYLTKIHRYIRNLEEENEILYQYYNEAQDEIHNLKKVNSELKEHLDGVKELLEIAKKLQGVEYV